jgi:outer membrane protein insertion porin family
MRAWPAALVLLVAWLGVTPGFAARAAETKPDKPAKLALSGYGVLGNRQLKRMLRTVELSSQKPKFYGATFVEDSALLLTSRIKRDGYLEPNINILLTLENGSIVRTSAKALLDNPLPRTLRATRAEFKIHKGVLYHFQVLDFTGLTSIPEKQARSFFMETETLFHPIGARVYTPERLQQGMSSLTDSLERQGYQEAAADVVDQKRDDKTGDVTVHVRVQQGPRFIVRSVQEEIFYEGAAEPAQTRTVFPKKAYSKLWAQDFSVSLKTNEYVRGFPDVTVELRTLKRTPEGGRMELDMLASVKRGPQVRVGAVKFEGDKRTSHWLMSRRARVERGDLLNPIRTEAGRVRLAELGVFDTVDLRYKDVDEHTRDVIYQVKEGKALTVSLLAGWGSYEMLRGGVLVSENNIFGLAHRADLKAIQSFKASSGDFRYTVPEAVGHDVDLFIHGSGLRREEADFTRLEYGGGLGAHKYFKPNALDVTMRYDYQILSTLNTVPEVVTEGLTNPAVGSITFDLKLDRRDSPLYPRKGYKIFATIETASEYMGGEANYERVEVSPSWHHPIGGGRYLSLGLSHGFAWSFGSAAQNLPFNKRFFPGGSESIRGYDQDEASPRNEKGQIVGAETYILGTVQLEQALTTRWSLIVFSDSLGFARRLEHYPFDTGLFSVGGGIWWKTLIGPVRLEYGYNINPRPKDPTGTIQFSIGFPF